jgi:two-component system, NarL family, invasion response regulator UvrY
VSREKLRVLVVDDHAPFRRAAINVIAAAPGFELAGEAASGEDAVEMAAAFDPDIVLLDVNMPGIGGIEAARRIAAHGGDTVIVLVSGDRPHELPDAARTCGAAASVHKADFGHELLARLLSQVQEHRLDTPADLLLPRDAELGKDRMHVLLH